MDWKGTRRKKKKRVGRQGRENVSGGRQDGSAGRR
jgi:hypothetical protein